MEEGLDWETAQAKPRLKEHVTTFHSWADEGHLPSVYLVALAYLKGNGVAKDNDKASWADWDIGIPGWIGTQNMLREICWPDFSCHSCLTTSKPYGNH